MALVPASKWTAAAAAGLNPGASTGAAGGGATGGTISSGVLGLTDPSMMVGTVATAVTPATGATWPVANLALLLPFVLTTAQTAQSISVGNGFAVSGNLDAGIYNEDGTRVVANGGTAQAGVNSWQTLSITATALAAGSYYLAVILDNVTGVVLRMPIAAASLRAAGAVQVAAAVPLAASLTFANMAQAYGPMVAIAFTTVF